MENHLFRIHHKIKLQLDAICQEAGDMNVEEFMQVYESLKKDNTSFTDNLWSRTPKKINGKYPSITRNFQEDALDAMDYGQDELDTY